MRTAIFAFFLAMFAMLCSANAVSIPAEAASLEIVEKRGVSAKTSTTAGFDATVNLLVKANADIVVKAFADVCTDADLSTAIKSNLRFEVKGGLFDFDFGIGSRLTTAVSASIKAAVKAEVDAEIKAEFTASLKANIAAIITKRCPKKDNACIRTQSKTIVSEAIKLTTKASAKISAKISAKLDARIKAAVEVQLKKFQLNLLIVRISIKGDIEVSKSIVIKFKATAGLIVKACASIQAKLVSQIKTICA
ncbi:hypothetical protein BGW38_010697 [Lunasporangiospora selenospora]|uniref:Uncharacterized protein n=1 Tax=Lunasporangiospora selenospora TaxID=979761 RepID=A0A9P6FWE0_9FUNG|nr:hypothetical protein BGW38_010697 [Lunasporangiospora selenospora]